MFVLVTTGQLMLVIAGVLTAHLIWNNPGPCPKEYIKLEHGEIRKVDNLRTYCELKKYGYNRWHWVLKEN